MAVSAFACEVCGRPVPATGGLATCWRCGAVYERYPGLAVVKAAEVAVTVVPTFERPSLPDGWHRLWPGNGYFTHAKMVAKWKEGYGTVGQEETNHELHVDCERRSDVAWHVWAGAASSATYYWYQNVALKPADGCDVVITRAYVITRSSYGWGTKGANPGAWLVIGEPNMEEEIASAEVSGGQTDWADQEGDLAQFLFAGDYALGVALRAQCTSGWHDIDGAFVEFRYAHAKLTLKAEPESAGRGETITLSGNLKVKDEAEWGRTIYLKALDPDGTEHSLGSTMTDARGDYSLDWEVPADAKFGTWTIWAETSGIYFSPREAVIYSRPLAVGVGVYPEKPFPWGLVALGAGAAATAVVLFLLARRRR